MFHLTGAAQFENLGTGDPSFGGIRPAAAVGRTRRVKRDFRAPFFVTESIGAPAMSPPAPPFRASALLLDIEGTTTSINFVKDILFPHATENVEKYLESSWEDQKVQDAIEGMRQQAAKDVEAKIEGAVPIPDKDSPKAELIEAVGKSLKWLISIDNKNTHMKELSGFIWQKGYEDGQLKGHLYDDVEPAFKSWKSAGLKIYIYSSGSVNAQKLLMKYSTAGDLQPLIDDYFDTNVGHKREIPSYKNILEKIATKAEDTIFFTDIVEEANAASEAGINIVLMSREGNAPLSSEAKEKFYVAESFSGLEINSTSAKRKQPAEDESVPPAKIAKVIENESVEDVKNDTVAMEVDTKSTEETKKDETVSDENQKEQENLATLEEQKQTETKITDAVEEKTEMEVDKEESEKPNEEEKTNLECAVDKKTVETDVKMEESNKTDDNIVSDKNQVPLKKETEKEKDLNETTDTAEEKAEAVAEKTEQNGIAETSDEIKPEEKDMPKDEQMDVAENVAKSTDVNEETKTDNAEKTKDAPTTEIIEASDIDSIVNAENLESKTAPIINSEDIDHEKLNLLSEKTAALVKECDEVLSKVERFTNIIVATDANNEESDLSEITNGHKITVDELVTSNVLDEILPELPIAETIQSPILETAKDVENDKDNTIVKELDKSSETNNKNDNHIESTESNKTNGSNGTSELNGKANGKSETIAEKCEVNGQNSEHTNEKTNGTSKDTSEPSETDQSEIKVKKLPTEEAPKEISTEQLVET